MSEEKRIEKDSLGEMDVPATAYYAAQTARAVENFPISGKRFPRAFIKALGLVKKHAARANVELTLIDRSIGDAISAAAQEVCEGKWDGEFVVDVYQTGSGTSTNMNANEVIANRASEILGGARGDRSVHPNDHVNRCQSSNDVIPTSIHIAAVESVSNQLIPSLSALASGLEAKASAFDRILKVGRTHLQDATPMRLGQVFSGYAAQVRFGVERLEAVLPRMREVALGGTAIGTGINAHPEFAKKVIAGISEELGMRFVEARNHFEAQAGKDACVELSGALKTISVSLIKIANDIRFLGSGPRCGIGELKLKATQPGSSIMPGKVNPVMCEMLMQVGAQVIGNDAAITYGGALGNFELNVMMPLIASNLLESIALLSNGSQVFLDKCIEDLDADKERCEGYVEQSLMMCTALAPAIGYDAAAKIAKAAHASGKTIREVAAEQTDLSSEEIAALLDPWRQTGN